MQLIVAAVGHKMPAWIEAGFQEYAKPVARSSSRSAETVMGQERQRIEAVLPKGGHVIALDEHGKDLTTLQLSQHLTLWQQQGGDVTFVIGGADGLDADFKKDADMLLRVSSLTLPHGMVRVLLAEQLYRAWTITKNHPYHRTSL